MKTTAVFTDLTADELTAKVEEYNNANVSTTDDFLTNGTNWTVKHLFSAVMLNNDGYPREWYTVVFERD